MSFEEAHATRAAKVSECKGQIMQSFLTSLANSILVGKDTAIIRTSRRHSEKTFPNDNSFISKGCADLLTKKDLQSIVDNGLKDAGYSAVLHTEEFPERVTETIVVDLTREDRSIENSHREGLWTGSLFGAFGGMTLIAAAVSVLGPGPGWVRRQ